MAEITRELLAERRARLADDEKLAWANLNAVLGALQDTDYWLSVIDQPAETPGEHAVQVLASEQARA